MTQDLLKNFAGIYLPKKIITLKDLSWAEKLVLAHSYSFFVSGKDCFFSNQYISQLLNISTKQASTIVNRLIQEKYLNFLGYDGRRRYLSFNLNKEGMDDIPSIPFE